MQRDAMPIRTARRRTLALIGLVAGVSAALLHAQQPMPGRISNFKVAPEYYPPPHQSQMKTLVQGAQAVPQGDLIVLQDARLETFREDGASELIVQAPECVYDRTKRTASSSGPLHVSSGDGKFLLQGDGFLWAQADSSLQISNNVYTRVYPDVIESRAGSTRTGATNSGQGIEIRAARCDYSGVDGRGVYSGGVRATEGTNVSLTSQLLTLLLPAETRQLQTITAERDVVVNYSGARAVGQKGVYSVSTGIIRLTGEPSWRADLREGRGNELIVDRSNQVFQARGEGWLRFPSQGGGGLFNSPAPKKGRAAPASFIEIRSDDYEIRTNLARFNGHVRAEEIPAREHTNSLTCGNLAVFFAHTNELQRILAENDVLIRQDDNYFKAGHAYYTATNGLLNLTDKPSWAAGVREGRGDRILVNNAKSEMHVRGNAFLRLPAEELGTPARGELAAGKPGKTAKPGFADIYSEEYLVRPSGASFRGGVYASHPRMNWACETLEVESLRSVELSRRVTAEQGVTFDMMDEKGEKVHGKGDKAVYTYGVSGSVTNELVHLSGHPALLETTNATIQNAEIILDRGRNKLTAPGGKYWIRGAGRPGATNTLQLPKTF